MKPSANAAIPGHSSSTKSIGQKLRHELLEMLPVVLFFFVAFQFLAFTHTLMLKQYGISGSAFLAATIGALIVAKVVVLADLLPGVNRFPDKPLAYNVVWKTVIYFLASLLVRYAEHLIHFWRQTRDFALANRRLFNEIIWPHFWAIQLWLLVLLSFYCTGRELVRAVGRQTVMKMFFGVP